MFGSSSTTRTRAGIEPGLGITTASTSSGIRMARPVRLSYPGYTLGQRLGERETVGGADQALLPVGFALGGQDPRHIVSVVGTGSQHGGRTVIAPVVQRSQPGQH